MFDGIEQFEVNFPEGKAKFPIFYKDASASAHMFLSRTTEVRKMTPLPVQQIIPGITIVSVAYFNYRDTDIGPYKEIGVTAQVALSLNEKIPFPLYPIISLLRGNFRVHVIYLPVTTPIAYVAGVKIYNYPKFVADIDTDDDEQTFSLKRDGKTILEVKKRGNSITLFNAHRKNFVFTTYQIKDGKLMKADVSVRAEDVKVQIGGFYIQLGEDTDIGRNMKRMLISTFPILSLHIKKMKAILYLPQAI